MNLQQFRSRCSTLLADHRHACRCVEEERATLEQAKQSVADATEAQRFLQAVAKDAQVTAHGKIAGVISRCLSAVFDEPYEFFIDFVEKRGKTEADLKFLKNGREVDPMDASGGGVVDLASFACRLACLMLARPQQRRLIVCDEPFRMLSRNYLPAAKELLETLAAELSMQIIMVTHAEDLACGRIIRL